MKEIHLWPKEFEFGDATVDQWSGAFIRATDPESGYSVVMFLGAEAQQRLVDQIAAIARSAVGRHQNPN